MWEDKETTAPDPSVAPDGEQPSALARIDSIATFEETNKQFGKMRIFSMPELMDTHFPSRPCIIENLLPAGTYLLAGAPKIGKSFLVLQMAYQVSAGEPFLGFPTRQGTVLYLALEDTYERLQKRLAQMTERDSPDLVLSVLADTLEEDLLEQLESFLFEYPETVLVITKSAENPVISEVHALHIREKEFKPFAFSVDDEGLPVMVDNYSFDGSVRPKARSSFMDLSIEQHREALSAAFGDRPIKGFENVLQALMASYEAIGFKRGRSVMIKLLQYLTENLKLIVKRDKLFYYDVTPTEALLFDEECEEAEGEK